MVLLTKQRKMLALPLQHCEHPSCVVTNLEVQLNTKLHRSGITQSSDLTKVCSRDVSRDGSEVRVVKDIEHFRT